MVLSPVRGARLCLPAPGAGSQQWEWWDCLFMHWNTVAQPVSSVAAYIQYTHTETGSKYTYLLWNTTLTLFHKHTHTQTPLPLLSRLLGDIRASCELHFSVPGGRTNPVALCCSPGNTPSGQTAALSSINNPQCHVAVERTQSQHHQWLRTLHTLTHTHLQEHEQCHCFSNWASNPDDGNVT